MSTGKRGLGRGLDALLGADAQEEQTTGHIDAVMQLPITKIDVNPDQPRRTFDEKALMELAESIRSVGVIQPIVVAQRAGRYTIIAGERRYRAARLAGLKEMPAIVRDWDEAVRLEAALIENLQREDLNPIEEALGVKNLMEQCGYTQERAAERLGFSWEGRLRQRLVRKGRTRDSDMLSIIDGEWPARDAALRAWLAAENFTADGQQIKRLEAFR